MTKGKTFSIAEENKCVPGCTISQSLLQDSESGRYITNFSLAEETSISCEIYYHKSIFLLSSGEMDIIFNEGLSAESAAGKKQEIIRLKAGQALVTPENSFYGFKAITDCVYTEIGLAKETNVNKAIKGKDVFALKDLVPYQDGKIVNMDIVGEKNTVFEVMAFDAGCALPEHAAPGEALIFALDGKGIISYEGKDYEIEAGQNFVFEKGGKHAVKAVTKFKMALLLTM